MNASIRHNVELHLSEVETWLQGMVEKQIRKVRLTARKRETVLEKRYHVRIMKLESQIQHLKNQRDDAFDEMEKFKESADLAETSLRDGQAYARSLGRQLEELRKNNGH